MFGHLMGTVNPTQSSPGDTIEASDVNTPVNQLAAVVNGNIETVNIADNAVTTAKIADGSVTAAKTNFGGAGSGIWWQEIGRTTLGVAGDSISVTFTAKKYLRVVAFLLDTGGTISASIRFNSDSGSNYAGRGSTNGGADGTASSTASVFVTGAAATKHLVTMDIINVAAQEKLLMASTASRGTAGAGNVPDRVETVIKWANTADQITTIALINGGTGDYAIGSEVVVLGHD